MTLPPFPVDDATLDMLMAAIDPWNHGNPDATSSSVWPLLDMMSRLGGSDPRAVEEVLDDGSDGGAQVLMMRDPAYHDNDVYTALIGEVRRLRLAQKTLEIALKQSADLNGTLMLQRDRVLNRMAKYRADTFLSGQIAAIYANREDEWLAENGYQPRAGKEQ